MTYTTLITPQELAAQLNNPDCVVVDARFSLANTEQGREVYRLAHIPGALYAHLDEDLSGKLVRGKTGRHPLPSPEELAYSLGGWGIDQQSQVVVYDDNNGSIAARLWWLLRWLSHEAVAVLDGGWKRWSAEGYPISAEVVARQPRTFHARPRPELLVDSKEVERLRNDATYRLIDARTLDRYRGENEPIDAVAGHIPGAIPGPFVENFDPQGQLLSPEQLRERFHGLLGDIPASHAVFYCGSGVTAAHNSLAMAHAGMGEGRLYAGSWSEWITDPARPVAKA